MAQLTEMGFPSVRCEKALHATGNSDPQAAMDWLMAHMDDPDIDVPTNIGGGDKSKPAAVSDEAIEMIGAMGFNAPQARQALKENGGNVEAAIGWLLENPNAIGDFGEEPSAAEEPASKEDKLFGAQDPHAKFQLQSIICHKGTSMHAGHYVAFVRKPLPGGGDAKWVLFNDEKVAEAVDAEEMKKFAYIYFFRKV
jgi:ubiquitin carboxyl-terminal hydrolase 5/13